MCCKATYYTPCSITLQKVKNMKTKATRCHQKKERLVNVVFGFKSQSGSGYYMLFNMNNSKMDPLLKSPDTLFGDQVIVLQPIPYLAPKHFLFVVAVNVCFSLFFWGHNFKETFRF